MIQLENPRATRCQNSTITKICRLGCLKQDQILYTYNLVLDDVDIVAKQRILFPELKFKKSEKLFLSVFDMLVLVYPTFFSSIRSFYEKHNCKLLES